MDVCYPNEYSCNLGGQEKEAFKKSILYPAFHGDCVKHGNLNLPTFVRVKYGACTPIEIKLYNIIVLSSNKEPQH